MSDQFVKPADSNEAKTESPKPDEMSELMKSHLDTITGAVGASHDSWRSSD